MNNRGGKREGSGRPRKTEEEKLAKVTIRMSKADRTWLESYGLNLGDGVRDLIQRERRRQAAANTAVEK